MSRNRPRLLVSAAALALLALSACSSILPARQPAPDVYRLSQVSLPPQDTKPLAAQIVVDLPNASGGLDTDRIAVRSNPYELTYLAGARWTDHAPRLVQTALVEALESLNAFTGVGRPEDGIRQNFELVSDMRAFDILTEGGGSPHVSIVISSKLLRSPGGEVLASRLFKADAKAKGSGDKSVVATFDGAMAGLAADIAHWVVDNAVRRLQPAIAATPPVQSPPPAAQP
jgi:cholesterol transport system auxiliary component